MVQKDTRQWIEQARHDLRAAEKNKEIQEYALAAFLTHQALEKGLKALYIEKGRELLRTHDLVLLARKVEMPEKLIVVCSIINPSYIDTRYPDKDATYTKKDAEQVLAQGQEVMQWIEQSLSNK